MPLIANKNSSQNVSMPVHDCGPVTFLDLKAQFAGIKDEMMKAIEGVMESQRFILGPEVERLEESIANLVGTSYAVGCASGSDALLLSLLTIGIEPGDEVITTPFTFVATAGSIARAGAKPVFVDIQPNTFNIDPNLIRPAINARTRAIIPVHLFGLAGDLAPILEIANEYNLAVIEDAAQAIGAQCHGVPVGSLGTCGCFSFFPSKNLGGAGDGGLITTNDPSLAGQLRLLRAHGSDRKYYYKVLGTNSRLDALQAAILNVKLAHLDQWTRARQSRAEKYREMFVEHGLHEIVNLPFVPVGHVHVYNQFVIECPERDRLRECLGDSGIPTEVYYPQPLHLQEAFAYLGYQPGQLPRAEMASQMVLALPIYPEMKEEHQVAVVSAISDFYHADN
jgi:dTDP-4-amino-4,6-dideoxygalactose transaminase